MKTFLWMGAALAGLLAGGAAAANPFSDVAPSDWAYQAVAELADAGLVEGYPDGTFRGGTPITRYEMAQITARLLAKEDRLTPEERAKTDRLAEEYAPELESLGLRVANLERQAGPISWRGELRTAHQKWTERKDNGDNESNTGRLRLTAEAAVNDRTAVVGRFTTGDIDFESGDSGDVYMDRIYARHAFGPAALTLGRYELDLGTQDDWLYGNAFDGAELRVPFGGRYEVQMGFGRFSDAGRGNYSLTDGARYAAVPDGDAFGDAEAFYAKARADIGAASLGLTYWQTSSFTAESGLRGQSRVYGLSALVPVGGFRLFGDYYRDADAAGDPSVWAAGVGYGQADLKKRWSFRADVGYYDVDAGLYHKNMTGLDIDDEIFMKSGHFWLATATLVTGKNIDMHGEYAFAQESDDGENTGDTWMVSTRYHF